MHERLDTDASPVDVERGVGAEVPFEVPEGRVAREGRRGDDAREVDLLVACLAGIAGRAELEHEIARVLAGIKSAAEAPVVVEREVRELLPAVRDRRHVPELPGTREAVSVFHEADLTQREGLERDRERKPDRDERRRERTDGSRQPRSSTT
jgi:hypothetical protein